MLLGELSNPKIAAYQNDSFIQEERAARKWRISTRAQQIVLTKPNAAAQGLICADAITANPALTLNHAPPRPREDEQDAPGAG